MPMFIATNTEII